MPSIQLLQWEKQLPEIASLTLDAVPKWETLSMLQSKPSTLCINYQHHRMEATWAVFLPTGPCSPWGQEPRLLCLPLSTKPTCRRQRVALWDKAEWAPGARHHSCSQDSLFPTMNKIIMLLSAECLCPSNSYVEALIPQHKGVKRWGFREVMKSRGQGSLHDGISVFINETPETSLSL